MAAAYPDISVAPMMDWTDRHCRYFHRLIAPDIRLYTEMVTAEAVIHGDPERLLGFDPAEQPIALQLGGSDPALLARAARIGAEAGFGEINLNCGCPSDRVQKGRFGACLMAEPALVADCVAAMGDAVDVPVTVKCRIGIDDAEDYAMLSGFVAAIAGAGCRHVVVHARKAWLKGLSPRENREIPPLRPELVVRLKRDFPALRIIINGGIVALDQARAHLADGLDGVMVGRAAYQTPWVLAEFQASLGQRPPAASRAEVVAAMAEYAARQMTRGVPLKSIARHMLGLYAGLPGARAWRRTLSENAHRPDAAPDLLLHAARPLAA